uniref:Uncharacterized protein n=1 Tax=Sphaerodactylus townsendi TaxID=933632 RepID=A0ACB8FJY6_9SAUR
MEDQTVPATLETKAGYKINIKLPRQWGGLKGLLLLDIALAQVRGGPDPRGTGCILVQLPSLPAQALLCSLQVSIMRCFPYLSPALQEHHARRSAAPHEHFRVIFFCTSQSWWKMESLWKGKSTFSSKPILPGRQNIQGTKGAAVGFSQSRQACSAVSSEAAVVRQAVLLLILAVAATFQKAPLAL